MPERMMLAYLLIAAMVAGGLALAYGEWRKAAERRRVARGHRPGMRRTDRRIPR